LVTPEHAVPDGKFNVTVTEDNDPDVVAVVGRQHVDPKAA